MSMDTNNKMLSLSTLLCCITVLQAGTILEAPVHTAAYSGEEVRFNYSATYTAGSDSIKWAFYHQSSLKTVYTSAQGVTPEASPYYDVDVDTANDQYDLIIPVVSEGLAGKYYAGFAISSTNFEPELVVLSNMQCIPETEDEVREDTFIDYTCKVTYKGYLAPDLRWQDESGGDLGAILSHNTTTRTLTLRANVTASSDLDQQQMTCQVYFAQGSDPVPTYTRNCSASYRVLYYPNRIDMSPDPGAGVLDMTVGEQINCSANGNPPPDYRWDCNGVYHSADHILTIGSEFVNGEVNKCNCSAVSYISGAPGGYFKEVSFRAKEDPGSGSGSNTVSAGVIAAAVIVPLVLIGVAVAVGVYCFMNRRGGESEKPKSPYQNPAYNNGSQARPPTQQHCGQLPTEQRGQGPPQAAPRPTGAPPGPSMSYGQHRPPYGGQPTPFTAIPPQPGNVSLSGMPDSGAKMLSASIPSLNRSQHSSLDESQPEVNYNPESVRYNPESVRYNPGSQV